MRAAPESRSAARLPRAPFWFAAVGAVGFVVDASVLKLLVSVLAWDAVLARAVSFPCAVTTTWWLNRRLTFPALHPGSDSRAYALYVVGQTLGAVLNLGIYTWLVAFAPTFEGRPVTALAAAAAVALAFNYTWSRRLVFSGTVADAQARRRAP